MISRGGHVIRCRRPLCTQDAVDLEEAARLSKECERLAATRAPEKPAPRTIRGMAPDQFGFYNSGNVCSQLSGSRHRTWGTAQTTRGTPLPPCSWDEAECEGMSEQAVSGLSVSPRGSPRYRCRPASPLKLEPLPVKLAPSVYYEVPPAIPVQGRHTAYHLKGHKANERSKVVRNLLRSFATAARKRCAKYGAPGLDLPLAVDGSSDPFPRSGSRRRLVPFPFARTPFAPHAGKAAGFRPAARVPLSQELRLSLLQPAARTKRPLTDTSDIRASAAYLP
ncbi:hypothetical protein DIPPA_34504 [Diplonema papillatum]|nr:hypothetical protein DIPPA_34504 [Diplonema papillatum]